LPSDDLTPPTVHVAELKDMLGKAGGFRLDPLLIIVVLAAFISRLVAALQSFDFLITYSFIPDDAFYYADIARNILAGKGVTYDGLAPTNGFHPLHLVLILPLFAVFGKFAAVHAVLALAAVYDAVTTFFIYRVTRNLTGRRNASLAAAAFFALNPIFMNVTINGLETALSLMMVAALFYAFVAWRDEMTLKRAVIFGILAGLMMLARTDNVMFFILFLLAMVLPGRGRRRILTPLVCGLVATAVMAPWLIWNLSQFGEILQVSGKASPWVIRTQFEMTEGAAGASATTHSAKIFLNHIFGKTLKYTGFGKGFCLLLTFALILPWFLPSDKRKRHWRACGFLLIPLLFILSLVTVHAGIRWFMMAWYFGPMTFASSVFLGIVLALICEIIAHYRERKTVVETGISPEAGKLFIIITVAVLFVFSLFYSWKHFTIRAPAWMEMAKLVKSATPADARIGAFNSGVVGYFSERHTVNLDAVVNNEAYNSLVEGRFIEYIRKAEIDYIADMKEFFMRFDIAADGKLVPVLELVCSQEIYYNPGKPDRITTLDIYRVLPPRAGAPGPKKP